MPNYETRLTAVRERMQKIIELYLQRAAAAAAAAGNYFDERATIRINVAPLS
jgi:hypothetical protein